MKNYEEIKNEIYLQLLNELLTKYIYLQNLGSIYNSPELNSIEDQIAHLVFKQNGYEFDYELLKYVKK